MGISKEDLYHEYIELNKNRNTIAKKYNLSPTKVGTLLQKYGIKRKTVQRHGLHKHPLNIIWQGMKQRCSDINAENYKFYGGRGISVCEDWKESFLSFYEWAIINGWYKGLQLDRKDNNGNYCPENCCWSTQRQQFRNRRSNVSIEIDGVSKQMCEWEEFLGLKPKRLAKWKHRNGEVKMIEKMRVLLNESKSN